MLVAVAGIFELRAAFKVLEDQLIRPATHDGPSSDTVAALVNVRGGRLGRSAER